MIFDRIIEFHHQAHMLATKMLSEDSLLCIATFGAERDAYAFSVCERRCRKCERFVRHVRGGGGLPVKVQRIRRSAEAATPAAAHGLPGATRGGPP